MRGVGTEDRLTRTRPGRLAPFAAPPVSALLLIAGFPYYNIYILPWLALVPLFFALRGRTTRARCLMGYAFGVVFFGVLFYWFTLVRYPASLGYLIFVVLFPLIFVPWAALTGWALDRGSAPALLLPPVAWAAIEFLMSHGTFAFPWWSLSVSQSENIIISQIASITGMYGISFLVVLINVMIFETITGRVNKHIVLWAAAFVLLIGTIGFGAAALSHGRGGTAPAVRVSIIQPGIGQEEKLDAIENETYEDLMRMNTTFWDMSTNAMARRRPQLLLWPESVLPYEWLMGPQAEPATRALLSSFDTTLISGVFIGDYNSMIGIDPNKGLLGRYNKMHLVPFGEYVPYRAAFSKIPGLGRWLEEEIFPLDVKPGKKYHIFNTRHGRVGGMICFESMLPGIARGLTRHGAEMIVVATNDAWFKKSPAAAQHVALARLRAIENRRWLAQAANSGLSVIIDSRGRITGQSGLMAKSTLNGIMRPSRVMSFYTRFGDVFSIFCVILIVPLFAAAGLLKNASKA